MVFKGPDEHDGALVGRDRVAEVVPVVHVRGNPEPEDADQLGDRPGASRAGEDDLRVVVPANRLVDDSARVLTQSRCLQAGAAGLGVGVGVSGSTS
jgi:hypothetical protein